MMWNGERDIQREWGRGRSKKRVNVRRKAKKDRQDITGRNGKERCKTEKTKWDKHEIVGQIEDSMCLS